MSRTSTIMTAITSNRWINPPMVVEVTSPKTHKITSTAAIVSSIFKSITIKP